MRKLLMITIFFTFVFVSVFCTKLYAQTPSSEPPITYGVVATGATEIHAPETLVSGSRWRSTR